MSEAWAETENQVKVECLAPNFPEILTFLSEPKRENFGALDSAVLVEMQVQVFFIFKNYSYAMKGH